MDDGRIPHQNDPRAGFLDRRHPEIGSCLDKPTIHDLDGRQLIEVVEDHSDRGEPRVVLTLELGAEDEFASDDEIGRELEIGGQDMDLLIRNAGEINVIEY